MIDIGVPDARRLVKADCPMLFLFASFNERRMKWGASHSIDGGHSFEFFTQPSGTRHVD
jgi:hypothetical protein